MSKSVYLSPSNQENNTGAGRYGTEEYRMNQIVDFTQKVLEEYGVTVFRNKPDWNLSKIVEDSNLKSPTIHLAIHSNANNRLSHGCEVFCHRFGGEGEILAKLIYDEVSAITPTNDRGIKEGYNFYGIGKSMYELENTIAPAALVEVAFHDNADDANWIINHTELIGRAIANAVLRYFNIPTKDILPSLESALNVLQNNGIINSPEYWVQNGVSGKVVNGEYAAILIQRVAAFLMN